MYFRWAILSATANHDCNTFLSARCTCQCVGWCCCCFLDWSPPCFCRFEPYTFWWILFECLVCLSVLAGVRWLGQHAGVAFEGAQGWRGRTWPVCPGEVVLSHQCVYHVIQMFGLLLTCVVCVCVVKCKACPSLQCCDHWKRFHSTGVGSPRAWRNHDPSSVLQVCLIEHLLGKGNVCVPSRSTNPTVPCLLSFAAYGCCFFAVDSVQLTLCVLSF